jgi:hypothetical protein
MSSPLRKIYKMTLSVGFSWNEGSCSVALYTSGELVVVKDLLSMVPRMSDGSSLMIKLKARDCQTLLFIPKTVET